jgi:hypothetical protein
VELGHRNIDVQVSDGSADQVHGVAEQRQQLAHGRRVQRHQATQRDRLSPGSAPRTRAVERVDHSLPELRRGHVLRLAFLGLPELPAGGMLGKEIWAQGGGMMLGKEIWAQLGRVGRKRRNIRARLSWVGLAY